MSTIQQMIALSDGVSNPLQRMANNANTAVRRMENLGLAASGVEARVAGINVSAVALDRVSAAASSAAARIESIVPAAASARGAINYLGGAASGVLSGMKASLMGLLSMFGGLFALGSLTSIMTQAKDAAAAQGQADLKLMVIMRQRMGANNEMVSSIQNLIAAQQGLGVISRSVQTAGAQQLATFLTQKDSLAALIPAMNNLAAQQHGSKATAEDMVNISNMMGRALQGNVGALTRCGISFNSAQEQVLKFGTEAQRAAVMAEVITQNVGSMNEEMGKTSGGQAVQKMNAVNDVLIRVGKSIKGAFDQLKISSGDIQIGAIETIGWAFTGVINAVAGFAQVVTQAYQAVKPFAQEIPQFFSDHWSLIEPILIGVSAALAAYEIAGAVAAGTTIAQAIAYGIYAAAIVASTIAAGGLSQVMIELNAVMAANPIMFVVYAVIAFIAVFYIAVAAVNYFVGTSFSATGLIAGAFVWLGVMVANAFIFMLNQSIHVANFIVTAFVAVANFLGSVWHDPLTAAANFFKDIWNGIVDMVGQAINNIIDMINQIPGIDLGHVNPGSIHANISEVSGYTRINAGDYMMSEYAPLSAKGMAGDAYDWGAALPGRMADMFPSGPKTPGNGDDDPAGPGIPEALKEGSGPAKDTAGHTGRMADKMDDVDEDLKYLREVAEQEAINRYTTAEIKIDMGGVNNNVSSDVDLDGMIDRMGEGLLEAMQSGAEEVHPL